MEQPKQTNGPTAQAVCKPPVQGRSRPRWLRGSRAYVTGCGAAATLLLIVVVISGIVHYRWEKCSVKLPDGTGTIVLLRRPDHPYFAEYRFKVRFETDSLDRLTVELPVILEGETNTKLYWYPGGKKDGRFIGLQDEWGLCVFNRRGEFMGPPHRPDSSDTAGAAASDESDGEYLGTFRDDSDGRLSFEPSDRYIELMEKRKPDH